MVKKRFDYAWGNPYFLLDILSDMYKVSNSSDIKSLTYGPYEGTPELIHETFNVIKKLTDNRPTYILITNGASSAINLLLRRFKAQGGKVVQTTQYGYPSYEEMIKRAGLTRLRGLERPQLNCGLSRDLMTQTHIRLIDSPENPSGQQYDMLTGNQFGGDIWDAVYHNPIYTKKKMIQPRHEFFVGSYSKLLGVAGARIGFIATDNALAYEALLTESRNEMTGISRPSMDMITDILQKIDLDLFMTMGHRDLCYNKEEFQKIEYLFDGQPVNEVGMFYCAKIHPTAKRILDDAGVEYVMLDEETIRLSMGQTKQVVKDGIKAILKEDKK
jgi:aspartate/methionine/tyrosine aminotransferase